MSILANRDSSIPKTCHELSVNTPYLPYRLGGYASLTLSLLSSLGACNRALDSWLM